MSCQYRVSTKALIRDGPKLLLAEEKGGGGFELPGGGIENGETVQQALTRELNEEMGTKPSKISENPKFVWIINGEVIWLVYEVGVAKNPPIAVDKRHNASAGFYNIEELLGKEKHGLGYCCTMYFEELQKYLATT